MINPDFKREYYVAFNHFLKIGPIRLKRLENFFPNLEDAFKSPSDYLEKAGLEPNLAAEFISWRRSFSLAKALADLEKEKINFITWHEAGYPELLSVLPAPPPLLYYQGDWRAITSNPNRLAVVGSRQHSAYANRAIEELLSPVARTGIVIVSGLAYGVDALAHQIALNNQGKTIAVLGSGLSHNHIYPRANQALAEKIRTEGGLLISEFPLNMAPFKQNFPQRNRIISGLSQATLVIEAKEKSGALITAACALEQNREVLAVPGNIFSEFSVGPNNLINEGAKPISRPADILEIFKIEIKDGTEKRRVRQFSPFAPENKAEKIIYDLICRATERGEKISAEEIIQAAKLDTARINSTLSILEIKNIVLCDDLGYEIKN
jgi:DNA processing protein